VELPRASWIASANPFPWGIQNSFDGNPVTFWESGDALSAGSDVEVAFASPLMADSVLLETSPNQPDLRLVLYGRAASGAWHRLDGDPDIFSGSVPDLRQASVAELKRRGIGYVLLFSEDTVSQAVADGGAAAGMLEIGQSDGAKLYRLQ
jgi:hypothetical protein